MVKLQQETGWGSMRSQSLNTIPRDRLDENETSTEHNQLDVTTFSLQSAVIFPANDEI
ncbi:hypothetical protein OSCI_3620019 [Kamptonema sp. PCC 6506]|nr:hypothetical protein OSCI_3620019 [Kamptonema sp. PCC 6506]